MFIINIQLYFNINYNYMKHRKLRPTTARPSNINQLTPSILDQTTSNKQNLFSSPKNNSKPHHHPLSPFPGGSSQNDTFTQRKQQELIDSILKNSIQKRPIEGLLHEERNHHSIIQKRKEQMDNINLIEQNNIKGLYDWKTLFNNSRPLSQYTRLNKNKNDNVNNKYNNNNNNDNFKFPCVLIDAPNEKFSMYFPKGSFTHKKHFNVTRAKSMNAPRENNELFYFSKELSDYYIDDLKTFIKKKPELKAKKRCESAKLRNMISKTQKQTIQTDKMLNDNKSKINTLKQQSLSISNRDISLAINKKNAQPLIQSIYHQIIEENNNNNNKDNEYGNEEGGFNDDMQEFYTIDEREQSDNGGDINNENMNYHSGNSINNTNNNIVNVNKNSNQQCFSDKKIINIERILNEQDDNNINNNNETTHSIRNNIKYDTYDINDPQLGIFKQLLNQNNMCNNNNNTNNNSNVNTISKDNNTIIPGPSRNIDNIQKQFNSKPPLSSNLPTTFISNQIKSKRIIPLTNQLQPLQSSSMISNPQTPQRKTIPLKSSSSCHTIAFKDALCTLISQKGCNNSSLYDNESKTNENTVNSYGSDYIYSNAVPFRTQTKMQNYTYYKMNMHLKKRFNKMNNSFFDNWNANVSGKFSYRNVVGLKRPVSCIDIKAPSFNQKIFKTKSTNTMNNNNINNSNCKEKGNNDSNKLVNVIYFNDFIETTFPQEVVVKLKEKPTLNNNYYNNCLLKGNINPWDKKLNVNKHLRKESNEETKTMISHFNEKGKRVKSAKIGN